MRKLRRCTTIKDVTLRELPSVHELAAALPEKAGAAASRIPATLFVAAARRAVEQARQTLRNGKALTESPENAALRWLNSLLYPSLRPVINATGVVLHTNLGRAPLPHLAVPGGYSNLEYDLATGRRGKRDVHAGVLLEALLGAPAIVVNNNASALYLILNELAAGGEVVVSRGELIEIGDGFRIPEIMQRSGAVLREVGTTNRTTIEDYRQAIGPNTRVLLRVHPSNFRITGFTARPSLKELAELGRQTNLPVYEDLGSGCLVDLKPYGVDEPLAQDSLAAGINLISFSGDKLLGGPQAGIIAGDESLVHRIRRNPMFRALRQDKLFFHAMEATLRHLVLGEYDAVPALRMIRMTPEEIRQRAEGLVSQLKLPARVEAGESVIGGGSTPELALPTWLLLIGDEDAVRLERHLRTGAQNEKPVIARIADDRLVVDLRTVAPEEEPALIAALNAYARS